LIIISVLTFWLLRNKNVSDDQVVKKIKYFITKNLSLVTLKMLEIEFSLDYNEINSLDKNFKPAKYIKKQRIDLTKKMLLDNKSISEISNKTGYSETYLIKNKYKFLN
jgi:AraC-like DNA-binding protein